MSMILVTGASGFIGGALVKSLVEAGHGVVAMSRKAAELPEGVVFVQGGFHSETDLAKLDSHDIDVAVHLGAVTGGCSERDGMLVNVEGTRCLMRSLVDRGCRRFVMASSIAAAGIQDVRIRPLSLPIADEQPCQSRDAYGTSKFLMEQVLGWFCRRHEDLAVLAFRLGSVMADEKIEPVSPLGDIGPWCLGGIGRVALSDVLAAMMIAIDAQRQPGLRIMNLVGPEVWSAGTVPEIAAKWYADTDYDLSHYAQGGHERDPIFDIRRLQSELGYTPKVAPPRA